MNDDRKESNHEKIVTAATLLMRAAGIPERYWFTPLDTLPFRQCKISVGDTAEKCTPDVQRIALERTATKPHGQLVCIGAMPDDDCALAAASWVLRKILIHTGAKKRNVGLVNAAWLTKGGFANAIDSDQAQNHYKRQHLPARATGYAIYNVTMGSDNTRCQGVRDLLLEYSSPVRIVVVAGCDDPYDFCLGRLYLKPDICCRLGG